MRIFFALVSLVALNGCATNFEPMPLPPDHPASAQAQEAPRSGMKRLIASDELTRKTKTQLARSDVPNPDFQSSGMSHDMSGMGDMKGMDHSKMPGMDMSKSPAGAPSPKPAAMEGMDHSKMKDMPAPAPAPAAAKANKEAVEIEMKKTSDEMKKTSDELKKKSDEAKRTKQAGGKPAKSSPAPIIYTCVMHPEVQQPAPGKCPKCGMTLVKKETDTP